MSTPLEEREVRMLQNRLRQIKPDSPFMQKIKREVILAPRTRTFTFGRDELIELLGGLDNLT